ncbi:hypothetical protein FGIG_12329 [Fasciola gigantica]|uniref:Uncharacterized protein n=1 Tax=Fasciola gigantica TaxID=46835 RepID=A0A504YP37_FASGI|nr:hypothetical protein FGIG_12329 [Fasciola gigantica]
MKKLFPSSLFPVHSIYLTLAEILLFILGLQLTGSVYRYGEKISWVEEFDNLTSVQYIKVAVELCLTVTETLYKKYNAVSCILVNLTTIITGVTTPVSNANRLTNGDPDNNANATVNVSLIAYTLNASDVESDFKEVKNQSRYSYGPDVQATIIGDSAYRSAMSVWLVLATVSTTWIL